MVHSLILSLALSGMTEISLAVNATAICQCDPLVVKAVVFAGDAFVGLEGRPARGNRIRYELRAGDAWIELPAMSYHHGFGDGPPPKPLLIESGAEYAEYDRILFDKKRRFVFDRPGDYEIRAVAETASGRLQSAPVLVKVKPRKPEELRKIEGAKDLLYLIGFDGVQRKIPPELAELANCGGNVGAGVRNLKFVEEVMGGEKRLIDDDVVKTVASRMNGIDQEIALLILGRHYRQRGDLKHLAQIVDWLPHYSLIAAEWYQTVQRRRLGEFVPSPVPKKSQ